MVEINTINVSTLKNYFDDFVSEKEHFDQTTYTAFSSGYIKRCSDPEVRKMSKKLDDLYKKIQIGYNNIYKWWESYNINVEGLGNEFLLTANQEFDVVGFGKGEICGVMKNVLYLVSKQ